MKNGSNPSILPGPIGARRRDTFPVIAWERSSSFKPKPSLFSFLRRKMQEQQSRPKRRKGEICAQWARGIMRELLAHSQLTMVIYGTRYFYKSIRATTTTTTTTFPGSLTCHFHQLDVGPWGGRSSSLGGSIRLIVLRALGADILELVTSADRSRDLRTHF